MCGEVFFKIIILIEVTIAIYYLKCCIGISLGSEPYYFVAYTFRYISLIDYYRVTSN